MSRPTLVVARKTLRDFSSLKLLVAFFLPYAGIAAFIGINIMPDRNVALESLPLAVQEQVLREVFTQLSFTWMVGFPAMVLVAVLVANGVAKDEQEGTLRILLSKPVRRRQVLAGKFVAVVVFGTLSVVAGLFTLAAMVYAFSAVSPLAVGRGLIALLPGSVVYAVFVSVVVASVGLFFAVVTASRLKTLLATLLVPTVFFAGLFVRVLGGGGSYEQFRLYVLDVNYHFGNVYVFLQQTAGVEFSPPTQAALGLQTGVYDAANWGPEPLVGGAAASVPLSGYVPAPVSVTSLLVVSMVCIGGAVYWFDRKDIS